MLLEADAPLWDHLPQGELLLSGRAIPASSHPSLPVCHIL